MRISLICLMWLSSLVPLWRWLCCSGARYGHLHLPEKQETARQDLPLYLRGIYGLCGSRSWYPAAVIGILFDDLFNRLFYNPVCVSIALIVFGVAFIIIERWNKGRSSKINALSEIGYNTAILIGIFQVIAAVFPGTSRSGATIVGALLIGVSRKVAAEYTFFLAIPVMFGASLLKIVKFGFAFSSLELVVLAVGTIVSFLVSMVVLKFLMAYIKKHDFQVFGWYRIVLGAIILICGIAGVINV